MRLGFGNMEMFIHAALESRIQLDGTLQARGGLNVHRIVTEPNAGMPVVHLRTAARDDPDAFMPVHFYPEEDEQTADRSPVACERAYDRAFLVQHLFTHEIIQNRSEVDYTLVHRQSLAALNLVVGGAILFLSVHKILSRSSAFSAFLVFLHGLGELRLERLDAFLI